MSSFRTAEEMSWTDGARRSNGLRLEWTVLAVDSQPRRQGTKLLLKTNTKTKQNSPKIATFGHHLDVP